MKKSAEKTDSLSFKINKLNKLFDVKFELLKAAFLKSKNSCDSGLIFQSNYTDLIDNIISATANIYFKTGAAPAIVALGGYGRKELAPYSDIDIVFVQEAPFNRQTKKFIESLSSQLWNIGLHLSASARTLQDCETAMSEDVLFLTSLLEKRWIWGSKPAWQQLEKSFQRHIEASPPGFFVSAKLAERDARHQKMGDSRYQLEPNIKEGKGGLRDIHTLLWIANFLYGVRKPEDLTRKKVLTAAETSTLRKALDFFWTVRCHLHFLGNRADDRLSFDSQPRLAELMGYKDAEPNVRAEKFMKDYFLLAREVGHLTRILCAVIEAQSLSGGATSGAKKMVLQDTLENFPVKNNRLTVDSANTFKKFPSEIVRIFRVSQTTGLDIHPDALGYIRTSIRKLAPELQRSAEAHHLFLDILLDAKKAEQALGLMNEADVLGALLPDFNNIVAHMQYDMYHVFTADEHTIRAVGVLHKLENGGLGEAAPLASLLFPKIHSRRALYVAMFLHDIAKGSEGKKHPEKGAVIAKTVCPRLGLSPEETETVTWLVKEHLTMVMTALKRDLNDPKTIEDFVAIVQSPERLKLLAILTTADIMAVGPDRWNNWKAGLLAELYEKTEELLSPPRTRGSGSASARLVDSLYDGQTAFRMPAQGGHDDSITSITITPHPQQDRTEVTVSTPDRKGLFAMLAGVMAASGASIVDARIFTQSNGMALDVFQVQNLKGHVYENASFLDKTIKAALEGKINLVEEIGARQKAAPQKSGLFKVLPRVIIDNNVSVGNTVIEVNGKDRPGFLYDVTTALSALGLQISAAKITTFGSRAVDVFYVRDGFGLKILHPDRLQAIENGLKQVLDKEL